MLQLICVVLLLGLDVDSTAAVITERSSPQQVLNGAARFLAKQLSNDDRELQKLGTRLMTNLQEVAKLVKGIDNRERLLLNRIQNNATEIICKNSRLKKELHNLANLTSTKSGKLIGHFQELLRLNKTMYCIFKDINS